MTQQNLFPVVPELFPAPLYLKHHAINTYPLLWQDPEYDRRSSLMRVTLNPTARIAHLTTMEDIDRFAELFGGVGVLNNVGLFSGMLLWHKVAEKYDVVMLTPFHTRAMFRYLWLQPFAYARGILLDFQIQCVTLTQVQADETLPTFDLFDGRYDEGVDPLRPMSALETRLSRNGAW